MSVNYSVVRVGGQGWGVAAVREGECWWQGWGSGQTDLGLLMVSVLYVHDRLARLVSEDWWIVRG